MRRKEDRSDAESPATADVSRRQVLAGGLLFVGGSSMLAESETVSGLSDRSSVTSTLRAGGDVGAADGPSLESFEVNDDARNGTADYTVAYEVSNPDAVGAVVVTFDAGPDGDRNPVTRTSASAPSGSVSYSRAGTAGDDYEITVAVEDRNGRTVDVVSLTDASDGTDARWTA